MADYTKGKIYRLVCNTTGQQYIGSTTQSLSQRLGGHKKDYKCFLTGKKTNQVSSFSILSENNCEMILIEDFPCENKNLLERRERYFIETMKCVNKVKPARTKEELKEYDQKYRQKNQEKIKEQVQKYNQEHKEEIKEYIQKYQQEHKEKIKEYQQKYEQEHKEEIKEQKQKYRQEHKEESQKYYQEHKEEMKEQRQKYHQENKVEINERNQKYQQEHKEKLTALTMCECGGQYQHRDRARHFKSLKHKNWLATHETVQ